MSDSPRVQIEIERGLHVLTLSRPEKRNAFDLQMLRELAEGLPAYEDDDNARCAVLLAKGEHFTAGLDLAEVGPAVRAGAALFPEDGVDPLNLHGRRRTKPLVMGVQGWCLTIGIELLLAADVRVAAEGTRFGQIEINRGIFPFGGATVRLPQVAGWANAMRWLLTGDIKKKAEAERIGLTDDVALLVAVRPHALTLARTIARRAPLGVQATLASAEKTLREGPDAAAEALLVQARVLMETEDAAEGLRSFVERREAEFQGK